MLDVLIVNWNSAILPALVIVAQALPSFGCGTCWS